MFSYHEPRDKLEFIEMEYAINPGLSEDALFRCT